MKFRPKIRQFFEGAGVSFHNELYPAGIFRAVQTQDAEQQWNLVIPPDINITPWNIVSAYRAMSGGTWKLLASYLDGGELTMRIEWGSKNRTLTCDFSNQPKANINTKAAKKLIKKTR